MFRIFLFLSFIIVISCSSSQRTHQKDVTYVSDMGPLAVKFLSSNEFKYTFDVSNGRNSGLATGQAVLKGNTATSSFDGYKECIVEFQFLDARVDVKLRRKNENSTCGLGLGVGVSGSYKKNEVGNK